jgi:hypothetical protein
MVVAYSIYYLILSFTGSFPDVPWSKCILILLNILYVIFSFKIDFDFFNFTKGKEEWKGKTNL